jgi:hypothetical protein
MLLLLGALYLVASRLETLMADSTFAGNEQQQSIAYRNFLYTTYSSAIQWVGQSPLAPSIASADSTFLHIGLQFGWIVLIAVLVPLGVCAIRVMVGRGSVAEIAIVGQLPLFLTVALITQYEFMVFFVAGIAVQLAISQKLMAVKGATDGTPLRPAEQDISPGTKSTYRNHPRGAERDRSVFPGAPKPLKLSPKLNAGS